LGTVCDSEFQTDGAENLRSAMDATAARIRQSRYFNGANTRAGWIGTAWNGPERRSAAEILATGTASCG